MKVVLIKDLEGYGFLGDVVEVKRGFANNYLIPRGLALPATEGNIRHVQEILKQKSRKLERERKRAQEIAKKLKDLVLEIRKPAGEKGKLFGAVTSADVVNALKEKGVELDRKNVIFPQPVRELGMFPVTIRLHREVSVEIKLEVKPEEKEAQTAD
ncbi:MAG TPA: 50S ribosomal protein L9 [Aquifex aeolicus]|uniref:Large ribosomal subunit protein bL9 n=1 Tax=Aquifex aeolicus TaxID=63363 RepID=A0A7C5L377_AQUAO|nr:50S ribosomal protein L9 [Aquifex aeolicus]